MASETGNREIVTLGTIAGFMQVSVGTVLRYISDHGLPVYRPAGNYRAWTDELDAWKRCELKMVNGKKVSLIE
jgi:excisionase family DNA binding protein